MSRRMVTGFERFDRMIGGGFPVGLTVFACDSAIALMVAGSIRDAACGADENKGLLFVYDPPRDPTEARVVAAKARAVVVVIGICGRDGLVPKETLLAADVVLRVTDEGTVCAVRVIKPHPTRADIVRFAHAGQGVVWETDVDHDDPEIPHGPLHAEAVRLAVMAERARWVHAMEGVVDDLRHRRDVCRDPREDGDEVAYIGRARGYEIAANTLKATITTTMEEPNQ